MAKQKNVTEMTSAELYDLALKREKRVIARLSRRQLVPLPSAVRQVLDIVLQLLDRFFDLVCYGHSKISILACGTISHNV